MPNSLPESYFEKDNTEAIDVIYSDVRRFSFSFEQVYMLEDFRILPRTVKPIKGPSWDIGYELRDYEILVVNIRNTTALRGLKPSKSYYA